MLATSLMSQGTQCVFLLVALLLFVISAVVAYVGRALWAATIAAGLALWMFVLTYNAFALS
jgi:hypothetical protein